MAGRTDNQEGYRFGFNGKEMDNEINGAGNSLDFGARIYDSRLGRWLSVDPLEGKYPWQSTYSFAANNPIRLIDADGREPASEGPDPLAYMAYYFGEYFKAITPHWDYSSDVNLFQNITIFNSEYIKIRTTESYGTALNINFQKFMYSEGSTGLDVNTYHNTGLVVEITGSADNFSAALKKSGFKVKTTITQNEDGSTTTTVSAAMTKVGRYPITLSMEASYNSKEGWSGAVGLGISLPENSVLNADAGIEIGTDPAHYLTLSVGGSVGVKVPFTNKEVGVSAEGTIGVLK